MKPYPDHWPKANPSRPRNLCSIISEQQKLDMYNRTKTTRQIAEELKVHETYVSKLFPTKIEPVRKEIAQALKKKRVMRKEFRELWGKKVIDGQVSFAHAADVASVSERTMRRVVKSLIAASQKDDKA
jgi:hypothetical protein